MRPLPHTLVSLDDIEAENDGPPFWSTLAGLGDYRSARLVRAVWNRVEADATFAGLDL